MMVSFRQGDSTLFKRNEIFYDVLKISNSGTLTASLNFDAYSSGTKSVVSDNKQTTGDAATKFNSLLLYPNPVKDFFFLQLPTTFNYTNTELKIFDAMGKNLKQIPVQQIYHSVLDAELSSGYYTVQIFSEKTLKMLSL